MAGAKGTYSTHGSDVVEVGPLRKRKHPVRGSTIQRMPHFLRANWPRVQFPRSQAPSSSFGARHRLPAGLLEGGLGTRVDVLQRRADLVTQALLHRIRDAPLEAIRGAATVP